MTLRSTTVTSFAALLLVGAALLSTERARADTGHVGLKGGAMSVAGANRTGWHPYARTELGVRLIGPLELGGYVQMGTLGLPATMPSFGGGPFLQLRPQRSLFGLVPHAEVAGSRVALPTAGGRVRAWGVSVGGGLGYEVGGGVALEGRLRHQWYFGLPKGGSVRRDGWTVTAGVTYRLP